ncbi:MAG: GNAT family N-acetyltransferase [Alphaproteobacteria bacterium]
MKRPDTKMTIRRADLSDIDQLCHIENQVFDERLYHQTPRRQIRYQLSSKTVEIWIAYSNGQILGAMSLFFKRNSQFCRLYSIAVLPEYQGGEIGKKLFEFAEIRAAKKKLKGMMLEIRSDNTRHLERYKKLGYEEIYRVPDYYPDGMPCIKLKKRFE